MDEVLKGQYEELFSFLTIMVCVQLSADKTRNLNEFNGLNQCQYPGCDIIDTCSLPLRRKVITNLDSILKSRDYFANKGLSSKSYGFSSSHVWM